MKKIEAIIKPFKLDEVKNALDEAGIEEMTVSEVKDYGRENAHKEVYRGREHMVDFLPNVKIELVLPDNRLDAAVGAIIKGTKSAKAGGGNIFVSQIEDALRASPEEPRRQAA